MNLEILKSNSSRLGYICERVEEIKPSKIEVHFKEDESRAVQNEEMFNPYFKTDEEFARELH